LLDGRCGNPGEIFLGRGALFLTCFSENCGAKFLGEVKAAFQQRQVASSFQEGNESASNT